MTARKQRQTPVTLSDRIDDDYRTVADFLGLPMATFLRQILEANYNTDGFQRLLERAITEQK